MILLAASLTSLRGGTRARRTKWFPGLKLFLSTFQKELSHDGVDFANVAYTIWTAYANK